MKYEITLLLKSDSVQKDAEEKYKSFLENEGYKVEQILWWGKKTLAYEIKKQKEANFITLEVSATGNNPNILVNKLKLDVNVLRVLVLIKEDDQKISNLKSQASKIV